jgi:Ku protein
MAKAAGRKVGLRATSGKRTLAFGLVRVGVGMSPLMEADKRIGANLICPEHQEKVKRQYVCGHDHDVHEPEKAYPYGGTFVTLADGEVPKAAGTDLIDLIANVPSRDIPAEYVEKSYLIWPEDGTQDDGYALVLGYLRDNDRAMIGTTTDAGTTKAFAVRYSDVTHTLVAQLLSYEANVRWTSVEQVEQYIGEIADPVKEMADMAATVFDSLPEQFAWDKIEDDYGKALADAIEQKATKGTVTVAAVTAQAPATALMDALRASVEAKPTTKKEKVAA